MCRLLRYAVSGAAILLAAAYTAAIGSEVSHFGFLQDEAQSAAVVDRAHKSDKLPGAQASTLPSPATTLQRAPATVETMQAPQPAPADEQRPKILEGCDPSVSSLIAAAVESAFTGRCLAALTSPVRVADVR